MAFFCYICVNYNILLKYFSFFLILLNTYTNKSKSLRWFYNISSGWLLA